MNIKNSQSEMQYTNKKHKKQKKTKKQKKIILFIKGFNTNKDTDNIYFAFDIYLIQNKYFTIEYFNYDPSEDIDIVYYNLVNKINTIKYDILIGHSLGSGLLLKYCKENNISEFDKIIFLMPYIYTNPYSLVYILSKINWSFIEGIYFPQFLISNNCIENNYLLVPLKQICQVYKHIFLNVEDIINIFNSCENMYFIYANDEKVSSIDKDILDKINNIIYVDGNHTCFCERNVNSINFFKLLDNLFENKMDKIVKTKINVVNEYNLERDEENANLQNNTVFTPLDKVGVQPELPIISPYESGLNMRKCNSIRKNV